MKQYIAVLGSVVDEHGDARVSKMMDFDTQAEADTHVSEYGGFVAVKPSGVHSEWLVAGETLSVKAPPEPADAYKYKRLSEYPPIGDQLDAIWKHLQTRKASGVPLDTEADVMLSEIMSVKSKYPAK